MVPEGCCQHDVQLASSRLLLMAAMLCCSPYLRGLSQPVQCLQHPPPSVGQSQGMQSGLAPHDPIGGRSQRCPTCMVCQRTACTQPTSKLTSCTRTCRCAAALSLVCTVLVTFSVLLMDASSSSSCLSDTTAPLAGKWGLTPTPMNPYLLLHPELHVQDECSSDIELVQASSCRAVAFGCQLRCLVCRTCWLCKGQRSRLKKMVSPRSCRCVCGPGLALLATAVSVLHSPRMAYVLHQRSTWLVSLSREALRTIAAASSNLCKHTLVLHAHTSAKHHLCRFSMIRTTHMTGSTQCTTALPLTQHAWPQLSAQGLE